MHRSRPRQLFTLAVFSFFFLLLSTAHSQQTAPQGGKAALETLKAETLSFFEPVAAKIVSLEGDTVLIDKGSAGGVKKGMRLQAFKQGGAFIHPVTREPLGNVELPLGEVEVTEVSSGDSRARILKGNPADYQGAMVKIRGTKIRLLFSQGNVEWFLGDSYYQMLRDTGRFELVDTGKTEPADIAAEAKQKGTELILSLSSAEAADQTGLSQKLLWTEDSRLFSEKTVAVDPAYVKELRGSAGILMASDGEAILSYQLPYSAKRLAMGDIDGDGSADIIVASGDKLRVYSPRVDLKPLWEFSLPSGGEILWIDALETKGDKKAQILITSIRGTDVSSAVYGFRDSNFVPLAQTKGVFIRSLGDRIIGQDYTQANGFEGPIFSLSLEGNSLLKGDRLAVPEGLDIYGFQPISSPDGKKAFLAWDENGFLSLYNESGVRVWVSNEELGGFSQKFRREAPTIMVDRGSWSVKDRLAAAKGEVLFPKRKPLLGMAKGLGYKSSELRGLWWNGASVEERDFLPEISGEIMDYVVSGDRLVVLSRPLFGMRAQNILKGESPFGTMLYIFSLSGR